MKIIGAGLAGLIAGALIPGSVIYEAKSSTRDNHGALLRFRTDKISAALNIPFKRVRVTKAIWYNGIEYNPTPRLQNMYSMKVADMLISRSIGNIEPVDRYIAPHDFVQRLYNRNNIVFNKFFPKDFSTSFDEPTISTMPMPALLNALGNPYDVGQSLFTRSEIFTARMHFAPELIDLYQTIYFPDPNMPIYRASFTGNVLIVESKMPFFRTNNESRDLDWYYHHSICQSFGLPIDVEPTLVEYVDQHYGKIVDIPPSMRKGLIANLTHDFQIYSLGRFGTWRNILLDDVFDDVHRIMDLMEMDYYTRRLNQ